MSHKNTKFNEIRNSGQVFSLFTVYSEQSTPHQLTFSSQNFTFTRRTSGRSPVIFIAEKFVSLLPLLPLTTPAVSSSASSSSSLCLEALTFVASVALLSPLVWMYRSSGLEMYRYIIHLRRRELYRTSNLAACCRRLFDVMTRLIGGCGVDGRLSGLLMRGSVLATKCLYCDHSQTEPEHCA